MIELLGKKYISTKEAANIYGYSQSWFRKRRISKLPPKYIRIHKNGKIYYSVEELNSWLEINLIKYE